MLQYIRENLIDTQMSKYVDRFYIVSNYYSKYGERLSSPINAYKEKIEVIYDIASRTTNVDDPANPNYFSIYGFNFSSYDYYKSIMIGGDENESISRIVESYMEESCTEIEIHIKGECEVSIDQSVFIKAARLFNYISFAADNYGYVKFNMPDGKFYLKGFELSGLSAYMPERFTAISTDYINLSNVEFDTKTEGVIPYIELSSKVTKIDGLTSKFMNQIKISATPQDDKIKFGETSISLNRVSFDMNNYTDKFDTSNGVYDYPLISVSSCKTFSASDINLVGGDYLKLLKIDSIINSELFNINRSSNIIAGYTIGSKSVRSLSVTNINVVGTINSEKKNYVLFFDPTDGQASDTFSVVDFYIKNVSLFDADGLKGSSATFMNGTIDAREFISTLNCDIVKLSFKDITATLKDEVSFEGNNYDFTGVTLKFDTDAYPVTIIAKDSIKFYDCRFYLDSKDFEIGMNDNCYLTIKNTDIQAGNLTIHQTEETDEAVGELFVSSSNRKVKVDLSNFKLSGKLYIGDGVYSTSFNSSKIIDASSIEFSGLENVTGSDFTLDLDYKNIPFKFKDCKFSNAEIAKYNATKDNDISFENCSGDIIYSFKDTENDNTSTFTLNVTSVSSKIGVSVVSDIFDAKLKFNSNKSLGSCFWGTSNNVNVVPDMVSTDISSFETISEYKKIFDKVCYGGDASSTT